MLGELQQRIQLYKQLNPNELSAKQFLDLEKEIKGSHSNLISDEYVDLDPITTTPMLRSKF